MKNLTIILMSLLLLSIGCSKAKIAAPANSSNTSVPANTLTLTYKWLLKKTDTYTGSVVITTIQSNANLCILDLSNVIFTAPDSNLFLSYRAICGLKCVRDSGYWHTYETGGAFPTTIEVTGIPYVIYKLTTDSLVLKRTYAIAPATSITYHLSKI